jgi:plastocyanin
MHRPRRRLAGPAISVLATLAALAAAAGLLLSVLVAPAIAGDGAAVHTGTETVKAPAVSTTTVGVTGTTTTTTTTTAPAEQTNTLGQTIAAPPPSPRPRRPARPAARTDGTAHHRHHTRAHSAADPGVTIVDFKFGPRATTVHAGDTITWTNDGPSPHSATANNGSFDTGILSRGQSGSHTFTTPGTYTYFCKVHPFMHGTIVVLASTSPTTTTTPATTTPATTTPAATTPAPTSSAPAKASAPTLPVTGLDLLLSVVVGGALIGLGVALRRALS